MINEMIITHATRARLFSMFFSTMRWWHCWHVHSSLCYFTCAPQPHAFLPNFAIYVQACHMKLPVFSRWTFDKLPVTPETKPQTGVMLVSKGFWFVRHALRSSWRAGRRAGGVFELLQMIWSNFIRSDPFLHLTRRTSILFFLNCAYH